MKNLFEANEVAGEIENLMRRIQQVYEIGGYATAQEMLDIGLLARNRLDSMFENLCDDPF